MRIILCGHTYYARSGSPLDDYQHLTICRSNMHCTLNTAHTTSPTTAIHTCNPHLPCSTAINDCSCSQTVNTKTTTFKGNPDSSHYHAPVLTKVYVRSNLTCSDHVEVPYHSSEAFLDGYIHCGCEGNIVTGTEAKDI